MIIPKVRRATPNIRRALWELLGLRSHDGTCIREDGEHGDRIILMLRPSALSAHREITHYEGFEVIVRPYEPAQPL